MTPEERLEKIELSILKISETLNWLLTNETNKIKHEHWKIQEEIETHKVWQDDNDYKPGY